MKEAPDPKRRLRRKAQPGGIAGRVLIIALAAALLFTLTDRSAAQAAPGPVASGPHQSSGSPDTCFFPSSFPGSFAFPGTFFPTFGVSGVFGVFPPAVVAPGFAGSVVCIPDCAFEQSFVSPFVPVASFGSFFFPFSPTALCPGPPANVTALPEPDAVECGSQSNITVRVTDAFGFSVARGTEVSFTTTLGYITQRMQTLGGEAVASLVIHPKTTGVAVVTATAGNASTQKSVIVFGC